MADDIKTVWILSDGRPGHYNQSKGVVKALMFKQPLQEEWVEVRLRAGIFRVMQRELLKRTNLDIPLGLLKLFYRFSEPNKPPDMIVSAGGRTSFFNAWLARRFHIPNIFIGSLRGLPAELFSTVLTLEPIQDVRNNIVLQFPVSEITPKYLDETELPKSLLSKPCWALLVGGKGSGYDYRSGDWERLGDLLNLLAQRYNFHWLICTTPRTKQDGQSILEHKIESQYLADSSWFGAQSENKIPMYLAASDKIFVTEDSMTMIGEALSSGKPVFSLQPVIAHPNQRYLNALQRYVDRGLLARHTIISLQGDPVSIENVIFKTISESPLVTLSRQLEEYV